MPTSNNIIGACQLYYATFGFSPKPDAAWFDGVPVRDSGGTAVDLPTLEIQHLGCVPEGFEEGMVWDAHTIKFTVRAATLEDANTIARGLKYNGGTPFQFLGFDGASPDNSGIAFPLSTGQSLKAMVRQREQYNREAERGPGGGQVHRIELTYLAYVMVTG